MATKALKAQRASVLLMTDNRTADVMEAQLLADRQVLHLLRRRRPAAPRTPAAFRPPSTSDALHRGYSSSTRYDLQAYDSLLAMCNQYESELREKDALLQSMGLRVDAVSVVERVLCHEIRALEETASHFAARVAAKDVMVGQLGGEMSSMRAALASDRQPSQIRALEAELKAERRARVDAEQQVKEERRERRRLGAEKIKLIEAHKVQLAAASQRVADEVAKAERLSKRRANLKRVARKALYAMERNVIDNRAAMRAWIAAGLIQRTWTAMKLRRESNERARQQKEIEQQKLLSREAAKVASLAARAATVSSALDSQAANDKVARAQEQVLIVERRALAEKQIKICIMGDGGRSEQMLLRPGLLRIFHSIFKQGLHTLSGEKSAFVGKLTLGKSQASALGLFNLLGVDMLDLFGVLAKGVHNSKPGPRP